MPVMHRSSAAHPALVVTPFRAADAQRLERAPPRSVGTCELYVLIERARRISQDRRARRFVRVRSEGPECGAGPVYGAASVCSTGSLRLETKV